MQLHALCFCFVITIIYSFLSLRTYRVNEDQVLAQMQVITVSYILVELNLHILLSECIVYLINAKSLVNFHWRTNLNRSCDYFKFLINAEWSCLLKESNCQFCSYGFEVWAHELWSISIWCSGWVLDCMQCLWTIFNRQAFAGPFKRLHRLDWLVLLCCLLHCLFSQSQLQGLLKASMSIVLLGFISCGLLLCLYHYYL